MRKPFLRQELERQRIAVAGLKNPLHWHVSNSSFPLGHACLDDPLGRLVRQRLELERLPRLDRTVGSQRAGRGRGAQLVGSGGQNEQQPCTRQLPRHDVQNGDRGVVSGVDVVHHQGERAFLRGSLHRLEERVRQPQRHDLGRPLHRLGDAREYGEDLRRDAGQLA